VFIDETKERGYVLVAAVITVSMLAVARKAINSHVMPRQRRVHFSRERDSRRNLILETIISLGVDAMIYDASSYSSQIVGRAACWEALVPDLFMIDARRLVIEIDDAAIHADRTLLYTLVRRHGLVNTLTYHHMRSHEECLLAISDAIAWSWAKGGRWRAKVKDLVTEVRRL
jgi:hypothetical protein